MNHLTAARSHTGFEIIGSLAPDDRCIVLTGERHGAWVRLADGGWVNERYLQYRHDG